MTSPDSAFGMVDPAIFEYLQSKIDEDSHVREELKNILQVLEKQGGCQLFIPVPQLLTSSLGRSTQSILSRAHSTPSAYRRNALAEVTDIAESKDS
jgi:hypothetical protein